MKIFYMEDTEITNSQKQVINDFERSGHSQGQQLLVKGNDPFNGAVFAIYEYILNGKMVETKAFYIGKRGGLKDTMGNTIKHIEI